MSPRDSDGGFTIRKIVADTEYHCDKFRMTDDAVFVRINSVWTEIRPKNWSKPCP